MGAGVGAGVGAAVEYVPKKAKKKMRSKKKKKVQTTVFDRLHQQALEAHSNKFLARQRRDEEMANRPSLLSRETEKIALNQQWGDGAGRFKNQGHRLYEQGQANLKRKDQLTAKLHEDRVKKEENECTFKPQVGTPYTRHYTPYTTHRTLHTVHRTLYTVHRTPYTIHSYTPMHSHSYIILPYSHTHYTHHLIQVGAHSSALADMRGREATTVHEALYMDKAGQRTRDQVNELAEAEIKHSCTFQPTIGEVSSKLALDRRISRAANTALLERNTANELIMVDRKGDLKPAVHEELHADAQQRRLRLREYQQWKTDEHTFQVR
jgi:hypothetical protein